MSGRAAAAGRPAAESGLPPFPALPVSASSRLWPEPPEPSVCPLPENRGCAGCPGCAAAGWTPSGRPAADAGRGCA
jgi:hypothetical protein